MTTALLSSLLTALGIVYVKFVGSHAEYDKIDAETIEIKRAG